MAEYPHLPLFTDSYLAATRHLTTLQHGAYLLLLMMAWRQDDCSLPNDDVILSRWAGLDKRTWMKNKDAVMSFWTLGEDARFRQDRLDIERKYVEQLRNKNAAAGRSSALKRKGTYPTTVQPKANETSTPILIPIPIEVKEGSKEPPKKSALDLSFVAEPYQPCFEKWLTYKREIGSPYKGQTSLKTCYNQLLKMADNNPATAAEIVDNSIGNRYQGLFALKGSASGRPASKQMNTWDDNGYGKDIPL